MIFSGTIDFVSLNLVFPFVNSIFSGRVTEVELFGWEVLGVHRFTSNANYLVFLGATLIAAFFVKALVVIFLEYKIIAISEKMQATLKSLLMEKYSQVDYEQYIKRDASTYTYAIQSLAGSFSGGVVLRFFRVTSGLIVTAAVTIVLANVNLVLLVWLILAVSLIISLYVFFVRKRLRVLGQIFNQNNTTVIQNINEFLAGFGQLKVWNRLELFVDETSKATAEIARVQGIKGLISVIQTYGLEFVFVIVFVLGVLLSFGETGAPSQLSGTIAVFAIAALRIKPTATLVGGLIIELNFLIDTIERLYSELNLSNDLTRTTSQESNTSAFSFRSLDLDNVSLIHPDCNIPALEKTKISFYAGDVVHISGPSGSGKSTLLKLILGLVKPSSGEVKVNDQPIEVMMGQWWNQIGYLSQENFLMNADLSKNITLSNSEILGEAELKSLLSDVFLKRLTRYIENESGTLGQGGIQISGGERQRLGFARILYHERRILVLDESTSALDEELELEILNRFLKAEKFDLVLMVSHRKSTRPLCNRIIVLENGTASEIGFHNQDIQ